AAPATRPAFACRGAGAHPRQEAALVVLGPAALLVHVPVPALVARITMVVARVIGAGRVVAVLQVLVAVLVGVAARSGVPARLGRERGAALCRVVIARAGAGAAGSGRRA